MKKVLALSLIIFALYTGSALAAEDTSINAVNITNSVNAIRVKNSLSPYTVSDQLTRAAQKRADDMAKYSYFSHVSPMGLKAWSFIQKENYRYFYAGENLAINFPDTIKLSEAWMNSKSHKANILDTSFSETGVGIASGVYQGWDSTFIVQLFAKPVITK